MNTPILDSINSVDKICELIAHDLKGPLVSMAFNLESIKRALLVSADCELKKVLEKFNLLEAKMLHMSSVVGQLSDYSLLMKKEFEIKKHLIHTHDLIKDTIKLARLHTPGKKIHIQIESCEFVTIACDRDKLLQIFSNIIKCFFAIMPTNAEFSLSTKTSGQKALFIFGIDSFPVISNEQQLQLSLLLIVSKLFIEAYSGFIQYVVNKQSGTQLIINFPIIHLEQLKSVTKNQN